MTRTGKTVKANLLHAILLLTTLLVLIAFAGELDPRFDGRWIGVETFKYRSYRQTPNVETYNIQSTTVIGIAHSGKCSACCQGLVLDAMKSPKNQTVAL